MKTAKIFKIKPIKEILNQDGSYTVVVPSQQMSYFTPSGKARLKLETSYVVYRIDFDGEEQLADINRIRSYSRKSDALKAIKQ
jgi:hypothetical protein